MTHRFPKPVLVTSAHQSGATWVGQIDRTIAFGGLHSGVNRQPPSTRRYLGHIVRDSSSNIKSWFNRLDTEKIRRIRKGTEAIAGAFYSDGDWVRPTGKGE